MLKNYQNNILILSLAVLSLAACNPTRNLAEDEYMLNRNFIKVDKPEFRNDLKPIIKQQPNRRVFGVWRFYAGVYTLFDRGKETKIKNWVKRTIGEAPVVLDSSAVERSVRQLTQFMHNKGYFNAEVEDSVALVKRNKKKANVYYKIVVNEPYTIRYYSKNIKNPMISAIVESYMQELSLITPGKNFDADSLQAEREWITQLLRNRGFYFFTREYIYFDVDTALNNHQADLTLGIFDPNEVPGADTTATNEDPYKPFHIKDIYVRTDYDLRNPVLRTDLDTMTYGGYNFLQPPEGVTFKPPILAQNIMFRDKELFQAAQMEATYRRLTGMNVFRFVNIRFEKAATDSLSQIDYLNAYILLTPQPKQSFTTEWEGTYSSGWGTAGNFAYRNKNIFGGAELFEFRIRGAVEIQRTFSDAETPDERLLFFNTLEFGPEVNLTLNRILFPFVSLDRLSKQARPTTIFSTSYNYQLRPEYDRRILNFAFGYSFRERVYKRHILYPVDINFVRVNLQQSFRDRLLEIGDLSLINSYSSHSTFSGRYSFIYNSQNLLIERDFMFFRFNFETSGLIMQGIHKLSDAIPDETGSYNLFGVRFSQFIRGDIDQRFYHYFNTHNNIVFRIAGGVGLPYDNSEVLPFEKSFFAGGSNDIRAWKARTLGPGSYNNVTGIEQTGDIKIETNLEYRFDLFWVMEGATFIDAGNVWLLRKDSSRPGASFDGKSFYEEMAIGTGIGFRLNFNFFIIRMDMGAKAIDPSKPPGEKWVLDKTQFRNLNYNLGIGYPF
ncbi:MAG: BamA/TamA family outer membrane protein [Bacteroidia bacterium]